MNCKSPYEKIDWAKIRACAQKEKTALVPFLKKLFGLVEAFRREGMTAFENYAAGCNDPFVKKALYMLENSYEPELLGEILYTTLLSSELSGGKYLEYLIFVRFILLMQQGGLPVEHSKALLEAYLGLDFIGVIE